MSSALCQNCGQPVVAGVGRGEAHLQMGCSAYPGEAPPWWPPNPTTGVGSVVREEMHRLQSWVDMLEQKLQLALVPLTVEHGPWQPAGQLRPAAGPHQLTE